jgi:hypothetical protein
MCNRADQSEPISLPREVVREDVAWFSPKRDGAVLYGNADRAIIRGDATIYGNVVELHTRPGARVTIYGNVLVDRSSRGTVTWMNGSR